MNQKPKLLDQVRDVIRTKHYSRRTEKTYVSWIKRYIYFHDKRHPKNMGRSEIEAFLTHLAVNRNVAASTQNQAFNALLFLYKEVLELEFDEIKGVARAKKPQKLPVVFAKNEVHAILDHLENDKWLIGHLLYGAGLRLMECLRLRVKDNLNEHFRCLMYVGDITVYDKPTSPSTIPPRTAGVSGVWWSVWSAISPANLNNADFGTKKVAA